MSEDDGSDVTVLLDDNVQSENRVRDRTVLSVPKSSKFPEGVKYALHYGTRDGETIIRYDNAHGVHEKHEGENVEEIEYPGIGELNRRFLKEIEDK